MSDPSQPKGRPEAPAEGPTKAFKLKFEGWMTELLKQDLGLEAEAPPAADAAAEAAPAPPVPQPEGAPGTSATAPDGTAKDRGTGPSSG
jgi:hypothetical protein